jgi:hypothetical protein
LEDNIIDIMNAEAMLLTIPGTFRDLVCGHETYPGRCWLRYVVMDLLEYMPPGVVFIVLAISG